MRIELADLETVGIGCAFVEDVEQFLILVDTPVDKVDDQHLAGAEASGVGDLVGIEIDEAGFGAGDDEAVFGHGETRGAQAVAVERGADDAAIREGDGGGSVPGLDAVCVIFEEARDAVAEEGRRDEHAHGFRQ